MLCCILVLLALWRLNKQVTQTNGHKNHAPANGAIRAKGKNRAKKSCQQSNAAANASAKENNLRGKGEKTRPQCHAASLNESGKRQRKKSRAKLTHYTKNMTTRGIEHCLRGSCLNELTNQAANVCCIGDSCYPI